jgi:hypothetical protein
MVGIVIEECPWIFNVHSPSYVLRHAWQKNGKAHSISGNYRKYARVDPKLRRVYWKAENKPNLTVLYYVALLLLVLSFPAVVMKYRRRKK